jgi:Pyridoxal/pyridoxine/pyridoxamine kinase
MQKIAVIHDLSGLGRTSLTVVIPVLSALGVQVCPLPTAVLSSGTSGFPGFRFQDLTPVMRSFLEHWKSIPLAVDAVYSGFLGSAEQVELVAECARACLKKGGLFVVDPVMGDNGELEPTMGTEMVGRMRWLAAQATCITPNLTEAALLLEENYPFWTEEEGMPEDMAVEWLSRLADIGPEYVVITSVPLGPRPKAPAAQSSPLAQGGRTWSGLTRSTAVMAFDKRQQRFWKVECEYLPADYPGTGDTFTSVLTGALMQGDSLPVAMDRAVQFVTLGIRAAFGHKAPEREGIYLERVLMTLLEPVTSLRYRLIAERKD